MSVSAAQLIRILFKSQCCQVHHSGNISWRFFFFFFNKMFCKTALWWSTVVLQRCPGPPVLFSTCKKARLFTSFYTDFAKLNQVSPHYHKNCPEMYFIYWPSEVWQEVVWNSKGHDQKTLSSRRRTSWKFPGNVFHEMTVYLLTAGWKKLQRIILQKGLQ